MKKNYATIFAVLAFSLCSLAIQAQSSDGILKDTPEFFMMQTGAIPYWSSPNGRFLWFSDQGKVTIYDRIKDQTWEYGDGETEIYLIAKINNDGLGGGSYQGEAAYWTPEKGWNLLPGSKDGVHKGASVYNISSDGKMIVGRQENHAVGKVTFADEAARVPIVWKQKSDGTWDEYDVLPAYNEDQGGRIPQAFDVLLISEDNSVLSGRYIDNSGYYSFLIVYTRNDKGEYDLKICGEEWMINKDAKKPVYPRNMPTEPDVTTFMNDKELEAYQKDLKAFDDSVSAYIKDLTLPYPKYDPKKHYQDYFDTETEEGVTRWNNYAAAYQEYGDKAKVYNDSLKTYNKDEEAYFKQDRKFSIGAVNYIRMSDNGRYVAVNAGLLKSGTSLADIKMYAQPGLFDLKTGEFTFPVIEDVEADYRINSVLNDGSLLYKPDGKYIDFILPKGATSHIPLEDYIQEKCQEAYEDLSTMNINDKYDLGYVQCDGKGEKFYSFAYNTEIKGYLYWCMDLSLYASVSINENSEEQVKLQVSDGALNIRGIETGQVALYNLSGQLVLNTSLEGNPIPLNGLSKGVYIVKINNDKNTYIEKILVSGI